jgi:hypothetical protein
MAPVASLPLSIPSNSSLAATTCVSHSAAAGDQLVVVVWDGSMTVMSWANSAGSGVLALGQVPLGAVAVYDRDGDGDEDLLIGDAVHSVVHLLRREATGYTHYLMPLLVGPAAPDGGIAALAGGDLDGDGDGDVLAWNSGTANVHTVFDAGASGWRPLAVHADAVAPIGNVVELPVTVQLPANPSQLALPGASFRVHFDGWLVESATQCVAPQRVVAHDEEIGAMQEQLATVLAFPLPAGSQGRYHLELTAGLVAVLGSGERRALPTRLLHVTDDPLQEPAIYTFVDAELAGNKKVGPGDGGGDGNILGIKTGKYQIGVPPE